MSYFDTKTTGLVLRISPSTKTWYFTFRGRRIDPVSQASVAGPTEWVRIGSPGAISLSEARKLANRHRAKVDAGGNPAEDRRSSKAAAPRAFTFADLAGVYLDAARGRKRTWRDDQQKINRYLLPAWGPLPLQSITRVLVHELLDKLVADGMRVGVNRVQALVSKLFTVAVDRSLVNVSPASRMEKRFKEAPSERVLSDVELRTLWKGLDAQPGRASDALRLRLLLGQRGQEVAGMAWAELDLQAATWQLPADRTKNGRPHLVPLPKTAIRMLNRIEKTTAKDEPRVFPGLTLRSDDYRALSAIHAGTYEWKDLRRTVATRLTGIGFDEATVGRLLNHARFGVTARHYNQHGYTAEKRRALEAWDRELAAIVSGRRPAATVLPMALASR